MSDSKYDLRPAGWVMLVIDDSPCTETRTRRNTKFMAKIDKEHQAIARNLHSS